MEIFRNKILVKLIAILCIFLTLLNLGLPNKVFADGDDKVAADFLVTPITQLLTAIADGIMTLLQRAVLEQDISIIEISGVDDWWSSFGQTALTIIVTLGLIAVAAFFLPGSFAVGVLIVGAVEVATSVVFGGGRRSCK